MAAMPAPPMPDPSVVKVENLAIKGPDGDDLRLLVLLPSGSTTLAEGTPVVREQCEHLSHFGQLMPQPPISNRSLPYTAGAGSWGHPSRLLLERGSCLKSVPSLSLYAGWTCRSTRSLLRMDMPSSVQTIGDPRLPSSSGTSCVTLTCDFLHPDWLLSTRSRQVSNHHDITEFPKHVNSSPVPRTAANDVLATWKFATSDEAASRLHIDPRRIALYGSSAGAALAGGLAIRIKDHSAQTQPLLTILDR